MFQIKKILKNILAVNIHMTIGHILKDSICSDMTVSDKCPPLSYRKTMKFIIKRIIMTTMKRKQMKLIALLLLEVIAISSNNTLHFICKFKTVVNARLDHVSVVHLKTKMKNKPFYLYDYYVLAKCPY